MVLLSNNNKNAIVCGADCGRLGIWKIDSMTTKNEPLFDGNEEKKLSEIDQLVVYATHVQVHQRHMAINFIVNNLLTLCKHDIKKLFVVIDTLQKDQAISVRALLAEKLFEIGSHFSGHSKLGRYITSDLYDIIYKSLTDCSSQVRKACYESVFNLLDVNSIPHSLVEKTLLPVVLESTTAEDNDDDELRADGVSFLMGLAPYMDRSAISSTVLPLFLQLTSDPSFHVRRACASCYSEMCKLVGVEGSELLMLEKFANLCEDNVWGVRKACLSSFPGVAEALGAAARANQLTELYLKLLGDQSRWVRLMAYQILGEFIATFRNDKSELLTDDPNSIVEEAPRDVVEKKMNDDTKSANDGVSMPVPEDVPANACQEDAKCQDDCHVGKINLSFRSDSDGDNQAQDPSQVTGDSDRPSLQNSNCRLEMDESKVSSSLVLGDCDKNNIFVANFNEFVAKMFGDASCEKGGGGILTEIENNTKNASQPHVGDDSNATKADHENLENDPNDTESHDQTSNSDLKNDANCGESNNDADSVSPKTDVNERLDLECSNKCKNYESSNEIVDGSRVVDEDKVCPGAKKSLLRSGPVLLLLDAASVEESEIPVFETALNFGTTHHRVRGKPTTARFSEEGGGAGGDGGGDGKDKFDDFDQEDDLMLIDDSDKLETADDFSKSSLSLPEERVASRPLSPVTCRTLKAGGGRWCRQTMVYVSSREGYGKMPPVNAGRIKKSSEFKQCSVPGKLLDTFLEMSDSYLSELFDSDIQLHCAYCFPAVTLTLGKVNWPVLREFYMSLVASTQVKVRRTLSYSIHEMALILGDDMVASDLLLVFDDFCCDVDEVKVGVVEHFHDFVKLLPSAEILKYLDKLPGITAEDNGRNWRMRNLLIRELEKILDLLTFEQVHVHLLPLVFGLMSDQVAVVRQSAIQLVGKIIFLLCKDLCEKAKTDSCPREKDGVCPDMENQKGQETCPQESSQDPAILSTSDQGTGSSVMGEILHQILDELVQRFANSSSFRQRQSFILVCHQLFNIPTFPLAKIFSPNLLLNPLLLLHSDAIVNVRITLCRVLYCDFPKIASLEYIRKNPTDLLDPINKLWNDSDPDVHRLAEKFLSLVVR